MPTKSKAKTQWQPTDISDRMDALAVKYAQDARKEDGAATASYANEYNELRKANPDQFYSKMSRPTATLEKMLNDAQFESDSPLSRLGDIAYLNATYANDKDPKAREAAQKKAQQLTADLPYKMRVPPTPPINVAGSVRVPSETGIPESFNIYPGSMQHYKEPEKALAYTLAHEGTHYYGLDRYDTRLPLSRAGIEATADGMAGELLARAGISSEEKYGSAKADGDGYFRGMLTKIDRAPVAYLGSAKRTPAGEFIDTLYSLRENESLGTIDKLKKMMSGYGGQ
jgi:hypothetical protein